MHKCPLKWVTKQSGEGSTGNIYPFIENTMNSRRYKMSLEHFFLPVAYFQYGTGCSDFVVLPFNSSSSRSNHWKEWFVEFDMEVLNWLALFSDLDPIEHVWGALPRAVYSSRKQFNSVEDLKQTIDDQWDFLSTDMVRKYIENMRE